MDGGWAAWYNWSSCSTSCGIGVKTRRRTCSKPVPQHGGINCPGNNTQVHSCFDRACPGIFSVFEGSTTDTGLECCISSFVNLKYHHILSVIYSDTGGARLTVLVRYCTHYCLICPL